MVSWRFRTLLLLAMAATFALITLGGVVRVTGSGLGCPDWPLCHGRIIPPLEFHVLIEYSHRLTASLVSLLVVLSGIATWWKLRHNKGVFLPVTAAVLLLGVEVVLGGITVLWELPPTIVAAHLATAEGIFALLILALVFSFPRDRVSWGGNRGRSLWFLAVVVGTFLVLMSGSYTVGAGASAACPSWPLCTQGLLPANSLAWTHMAHRLFAGLVGLATAWAAWLSWRARHGDRLLGILGLLVLALLVAQVLAGAANPWSGFVPAAQAVHLSLATAVWGSVVAMAALASSPRKRVPEKVEAGTASPSAGGRSGWLRIVSDYITLTKPRIMVLLLVTALGGMILAAEGVPPLSLVATVMIGGALASGGASAINHYLDRDIDQRMRRTRQRPVASQRVSGRAALLFGLVLNLLAFLLLWLAANLISAALAIAGSLFYVLVYTQWLKRSTPHNIVIGGAAGAVPPLVGWAAVEGTVALPALYLFAIIFFWTPPHFWTLALMVREDYAAAGVPMLPVVHGEARTKWAILLYVILLDALTMLFATSSQSLGIIYLGTALVLGGLFTYYALKLLRSQGRLYPLKMYKFSLLYLALLFGMIMVDSSL